MHESAIPDFFTVSFVLLAASMMWNSIVNDMRDALSRTRRSRLRGPAPTGETKRVGLVRAIPGRLALSLDRRSQETWWPSSRPLDTRSLLTSTP